MKLEKETCLAYKRIFVTGSLFLIIVFTISTTSAARLPIVGGDNDNWGTILVDYLNNSLGENATSLNVSQGNITLGQKITFSLGAIIDNLITGWITITGNLNVVGNTTFNGVSINNLTFNPILGYTTSSYDGNITNGTLIGYSAANAICNSEYTNGHFCLKSEILKTISNGNYSFGGTAWFQNGPPGYTADADDCAGWTTASNTYLGPFWNWDGNTGAGYGRLTNCAQTKQLMCCGGNN